MMINTKEDNTLLASLAVFRELYNAERDVYGIISIFLNDLIQSQSLYSFNLHEIANRLNSLYEFDIPEAVVKTSLGRLKFVTKTGTNYSVSDRTKLKAQSISQKQLVIITSNENIIGRLFNYIESQKKSSLSDFDKQKVVHSFCCFLLDQNNGDEYLAYITAFILVNEKDIDFKSQLNLIREGVILYSGIKYNNNLNDLGTWRESLTIYIDTEILFHLAGYHGELYKNLALDFLNFVMEINNKAQKKLISLRYFVEVRNEIEGFFKKAKSLVDGKRMPIPSGTAMVAIVNGCKDISDISEKRTDFYLLLRAFGIEEDKYEGYYEPNNFKYNVVSRMIIDRVSREIRGDAEGHLKALNYISIHRKEAKENNFENIGCILLTGNTTTLKVAWNDLLKEPGNVPLATHLSFLTSKFWFKLNKGFGKSSVPKSFDIITKAQTVLSMVLNNSVTEKFEQLTSEFKSGKITEDQVKARIVDLRNQVRKPEEIKNDVVKDVLSAIMEDSLEKFVQEQSYLKIRIEQQAEDNHKLLCELEDRKVIEAKLLDTKEQILHDKKLARDRLERQKGSLVRKAGTKFFRLKCLLIGSLLIYLSIITTLIFYFKWEVIEPYTFLVGVIVFFFPMGFLVWTGKGMNIKSYLNNQNEKYVREAFAEFDFDEALLADMRNEIQDLEDELKTHRKM